LYESAAVSSAGEAATGEPTVGEPVAVRTSDHVEYLDLSYNASLLRSHSMTTPHMPLKSSSTLNLKLGGNMMKYTWNINGGTWPAEGVEIDTPLAVLQGSFSNGVRHVIRQVALNKVVDIQVHNPTVMQHPFHLHGHKFWVLSSRLLVRGQSPPMVVEVEPNVWYAYKDTINVPPGRVVSMRVVFDNPGPWLFHCHTSFHLARGMAIAFMVGSPVEQPVPPFNLFPGREDAWSETLIVASVLLTGVLGIACGCLTHWCTNDCPSRRHCCKGYKSVVENDSVVEMTPQEIHHQSGICEETGEIVEI
jgi:hypothetical protein